MHFTVMRADKLKGVGMLVNRLRHATRELPPDNADPARKGLNESIEGPATAGAVIGLMRGRWPAKKRKDAILCVEYVMSASPAWWKTATVEQQREFVERSMTWLRDKYGAENVIYATLHRDENSPHLSVFVVPEREGKLVAKHYIGNRLDMQRDQTTYAEILAPLGLVRGVEKSAATHVPPREFYKRLEDAERHGDAEFGKYVDDYPVPAPTAREMTRDPAEYAREVAREIAEPLSKMVIAQNQKIQLLQQRIDDLENTAKGVETRYGAFFDPIDGITSSREKKRALIALNSLLEVFEHERAVKFQREIIADTKAHQELQEELHTVASKLHQIEFYEMERAYEIAADLKSAGDGRFEHWLRLELPPDDAPAPESKTAQKPAMRPSTPENDGPSR